MVPHIKMIVATDITGLIAYNHKIPWREPVDQKRFKALTTGHSLLIGRVTYDDLPPSKLPNRDKYVLSSNPREDTSDTFWFNSYVKAIETAASKDKDIWIAGGECVYNLALRLKLPDEIDLTILDYDWVAGNMREKVAVVNHFGYVPHEYQVLSEHQDVDASHIWHRIYKRRSGKLFLDQ